MCGIFGVLTKGNTGLTHDLYKKMITDLFKLSESRGKEASGIAFLSSDTIYVGKYAIPGSQMIVREEYRNIFKTVVYGPLKSQPMATESLRLSV